MSLPPIQPQAPTAPISNDYPQINLSGSRKELLEKATTFANPASPQYGKPYFVSSAAKEEYGIVSFIGGTTPKFLAEVLDTILEHAKTLKNAATQKNWALYNTTKNSFQAKVRHWQNAIQLDKTFFEKLEKEAPLNPEFAQSAPKQGIAVGSSPTGTGMLNIYRQIDSLLSAAEALLNRRDVQTAQGNLKKVDELVLKARRTYNTEGLSPEARKDFKPFDLRPDQKDRQLRIQIEINKAQNSNSH